MRYLSLRNGIEAPYIAWHVLGFEPVAFADNGEYASDLLSYRYPNVINLGDINKYNKWRLKDHGRGIDIVSAKLSSGKCSIDGSGNMDQDDIKSAFKVFGVIEKYCPRWIVLEGRDKILYKNGGRDAATYFGKLAKCGYNLAYRIMDVSSFGLPENSNRLVIVGYYGADYRAPYAALFEPESLQNDYKAIHRSRGLFRPTNNRNPFRPGCDQDVICIQNGKQIASSFQGGNYDYRIGDDLKRHDGGRYNLIPTVAIKINPHGPDDCRAIEGRAHDTASSNDQAIVAGNVIRRLSVLEMERLKGFPDFYTLIPHVKRKYKKWYGEIVDYLLHHGFDRDHAETFALVPESIRRNALAKASSVPVLRYVGEKIKLVDSIMRGA